MDIKDFTGQGTALVGILNAFMENKGLITAKDWRGFCSDLVLLAEFDKYVWESEEMFCADICMSYFDFTKTMTNEVVKVKLTAKGGETVYEGALEVPEKAYGLVKVDTVTFPLPNVAEPTELTLVLCCRDSENSYRLTVYPRREELIGITREQAEERYDVTISQTMEEALESLRAGRRTLYLQENPEESIPGTYATDFWCYPMFRDICESMGKPVAIGTMGLLINGEDPLLSGLCTEAYTTPDWYHIIEHANLAVLDEVTERENYPTVQMIDNFERNHKLGLLYRLNTEVGELTVLTSRIFEITERAEVRNFLHGLLSHLH